jgi:hypothetical protein
MENQLGDCYKVAFESLKELTELERSGAAAEKGWKLTPLFLVHGSVIPPVGPHAGREIKHAWVETAGDILEISNGNQNRYSQGKWTGEYKAKVRVKYTLDEAITHAEKNKHYGPWDQDCTVSETVSESTGK